MKYSKSNLWQLKYALLSQCLKISLQKISSTQKIERILSLLCSTQNPICAQHAALFLVKDQVLQFTTGCNFHQRHNCDPSRINACHCGVVARKTEATFFSAQQKTSCSHQQSPLCDVPHYCIPLVNKNTTLGVLIVLCSETQNVQESIEFVKDIAHILESIVFITNAESRAIKEIEEQNRLTTLAAVASAVAHEVRNPLAGIRAMAQSIEEEVNQTSDAYQCSTRIIRQVDRLDTLLCGFFNYAHPRGSEITQVDIQKIVIDTRTLVEKKLSHANIQFHLEIHNDVSTILADPNQVQQVLLNLFLNSIDAIQQNGQISLIVEDVTADQKQQYTNHFHGLKVDIGDILFRFIDNGPGISQKKLQHIFDPFFTTKKGGTGLGLATAHRILKGNKAFIFAESCRESGTIFYIFFKRA